VVTDDTNSTKEPDMPTLMVRYEIDDNAVDDGSKVETAVAANKHGPNGMS
jgi:hypothetical protein